ncbi:MAG: Gfo/Idh/MocA family oxidoreductase [Planctomycetaceae bacterium]|jgi:predicted dehydrogenase|nr:Gfo/Idh/MocA family oxidoreductase [Planctomycetaceae bacterium]
MLKQLKEPSRRDFLKTTVAAGVVASPYLIPRSVLGNATQPGANETVKIALIGLGGRCTGIYPADVKAAKGAKVVAVSDILQTRIDRFMNRYKDFTPEQGFTDFRKMIEEAKPDAVMCETTTHQRAWTVAHSIVRGCHVYIEKPIVLTIAEGRYLVKLARKHNVVTQCGSQQRSLPLCLWACEQVQNGRIGKIKEILAPNFVGPNKWTDQPGEPYKDGLTDETWDAWLNQAAHRPFHPQLFYNWSNWWDYDAGGLCFGVSGWGTHSYDQICMAIGMNDTGPTEILLEEPCTIQDSGKFQTHRPTDEETGAAYYHMAKVKGPRGKMTMWTKDGVAIKLHLDGDWGPGLGCIVVGEKGKIEINRHKISSNPKEIAEEGMKEHRNTRSETVYHVENWIECIKSGKKANADIEIGQRATSFCELVNIVRETAPVGEKIGWEPANEKFVGNDKGNEMLSRPRRKGYELPELS